MGSTSHLLNLRVSFSWFLKHNFACLRNLLFRSLALHSLVHGIDALRLFFSRNSIFHLLHFILNEQWFLTQVESSDLISYGLIPEFIGRFPVLVSLSALNEDQLVQVVVTFGMTTSLTTLPGNKCVNLLSLSYLNIP